MVENAIFSINQNDQIIRIYLRFKNNWRNKRNIIKSKRRIGSI